MDQDPGIEKASLESKNISWASKRGFDSEATTIEFYKKHYSSTIIARRLKTPFAEVDLLFLSLDNTLQLVEVKSLGQLEFLETRVSKVQCQRLHRASHFLQNVLGYSLEVHLAFIDLDGKMILNTPLSETKFAGYY